MLKSAFGLTLLAASLGISTGYAASGEKPTIVLVHGAFADASSWSGVLTRLEKDGYSVVAVANPLRSVKSDGEYVRRIVAGLKTEVVLVGHSYGGSVITEAAKTGENIRSLVYVAAFVPDVGETALSLTGKFPGSTLPPTLAQPVELKDGVKDLYIQQDKFHNQFAADVSADDAKVMAATQRPVTDFALSEPTSNAGWKSIPSWAIYGDADKNIPPEALAWMAKRANAKDTVVVKGASHVVMVSNPDKVTEIIEKAAN
ncbi:alpha/beta hydrolase [Rhizobium sp. Leaf311]|uniref:alpha/beta fold hydrolase n=1 Tax=Rhizobium sp. Leaf311 TaxID=1736332 RepID=UPI0007153C20|nr:alpha/beta hydrolase [Rhizobium sp. Leaf311]KQQ44855.1 alpha/beta hydrolase [Rhizobium sp. Leaf311]